jgi:glycoside/pentoside/hexuronide:cation symporter, GPH family
VPQNDDFDRASRADGPGGSARLLPYGVAHFGKSLFWHSSELVFAFLLTERAGVPLAWMGLVLAGGLVLSACIDLLMGWRLRGQGFTLARACRLQFLGACASAAMITPLFAADLLPETWRLGWTALLAIGFRLAYALYDIPQNATLSLATRNQEERARLAAMRLFFSGLASIVVATTLAALIGSAMAKGSGGFALAALAMSTIAIGSSWSLRRLSVQAGGGRPMAAVHPTGNRIGLISLLVLMFVMSAAGSAFNKLEPYYVAYRWHGQGGTILIAASLGFALAQPLWFAMIRRADDIRALFGACTALAAAAVGFILVQSHGYYAQAAFAFAFGAANGGVSTTLWSSFAASGLAQRQTAFAFAMLTAISKTGLALAGLAIAAWLSRIDYRADGVGLDLLMAGFPIAGAVTGMILLGWSRIRARPDATRQGRSG